MGEKGNFELGQLEFLLEIKRLEEGGGLQVGVRGQIYIWGAFREVHAGKDGLRH